MIFFKDICSNKTLNIQFSLNNHVNVFVLGKPKSKVRSRHRHGKSSHQEFRIELVNRKLFPKALHQTLVFVPASDKPFFLQTRKYTSLLDVKTWT
jgi:hypothetical protein